ncbi:uncharacterized protein [Coffea arabica]|uniref:Uncharacterized protein n=1 Tax=Coffea arabica TaxID=13443 RepID=A0A6P6SIS7_COFAR|nr:uncharacterized protein LOC113691917 [Coffea arabica]
MESRRGGGQKGDKYSSPEAPRRRSFSKKPPRGSWQPTVPSWEKTFCKVVGSLDWEKLLYMKKFVYLYENVVKWDDSAGEEAFHNAKKRFLANMRGLPCDVTLPDPDLYIDEVDWDSKIDTELLSELEYRSVVPVMAENHEPVVIFGDSLLDNQGFSASGWGDCEADFKKATNSSSHNHDSPGERSVCKSKVSAKENGWEDSGNNACVPDAGSGFMGDTGWGDGWDNSWSWDNPNDKKLDCNYLKGPENGGAGDNTWDVSYGKKVNAGRFMSRYKTTRFHGNEQHGSYTWRNGNGRKERGAFVYNSSNAERWMNSCGPLSYHAAGNAGQAWNLEKPVS